MTKKINQNKEKKDIVNGHTCMKCSKFHKWSKFVYKYYDIPIIHVCSCNCATSIHNGKTKRLEDAID